MKIYIVRRGDSLYSIARKFGASADDIAYINQLSDPSRLSVGQSLVIPDMQRPRSRSTATPIRISQASSLTRCCRR